MAVLPNYTLPKQILKFIFLLRINAEDYLNSLSIQKQGGQINLTEMEYSKKTGSKTDQSHKNN